MVYVGIYLNTFLLEKVTVDNGALMSPDDGPRCHVIDGKLATYYLLVLHVQCIICTYNVFVYTFACMHRVINRDDHFTRKEPSITPSPRVSTQQLINNNVRYLIFYSVIVALVAAVVVVAVRDVMVVEVGIRTTSGSRWSKQLF